MNGFVGYRLRPSAAAAVRAAQADGMNAALLVPHAVGHGLGHGLGHGAAGAATYSHEVLAIGYRYMLRRVAGPEVELVELDRLLAANPLPPSVP